MLVQILFYLVVISGFVVLGILMYGIGTYGKGGRENQLKSNKIMRWRLGSQAVCLALLMLYLYVRSLG